MKGLPALSPSLLARQTPAVRAQLAAATKRAPRPKRPKQPALWHSVAPGSVAMSMPGLFLASEANAREHYAARHKRTRWHRDTVAAALRGRVPPRGPWRVLIVRVAPDLLDTDNNVNSAKHCRDQIAEWLGCGDSPRDPVAWEVTGEAGAACVRIVVESVNQSGT